MSADVVAFVPLVGANALLLPKGMHVVSSDGSTVVMPVHSVRVVFVNRRPRRTVHKRNAEREGEGERIKCKLEWK